ncbi:MAG TPA: HigA family addiction module antitoxin [Myxococcota bacterium]|nr:HigA family addiction module antitoxin [Myxococcota bacterium]
MENNKQRNRFVPDYLVTPGEVLEEYLADLGMTQAELADRTGLTRKTINEIIKAKSSITAETALKLERALGRSAHFWSNLERQYQDDRVRLAEQARMESDLEWLKNVPVKDMAKRGWIPKLKNKLDRLEAVLCFFGVASAEQWKKMWTAEIPIAYRQTEHRDKHLEAVSAWLRQGEIQARRLDCGPYDRSRFLVVLDEIRKLTTKAPDVFAPKLQELCASAGVALVFVPELPKIGIYGATRWMDGKPVMQITLYRKSNDHFWFTIFHEAGHILKHGRKEVFIEGKGLDGEKEEEANAYARDKLIPPGEMREFLKKSQFSSSDIQTFAQEIGIAPGIVVGRMQHDKKIPFNSQLNKLKESYCWVDEEAE